MFVRRFTLLEDLGKQREEPFPERDLDGVDAAVEVRFADDRGHIAVLFEESAGLFDVATEEGRGHQRDGHHLGGRQQNLGIIAVVDGLEEIVAQAVDGGYGIVHVVLLIQREGFRRPSDQEDIVYWDTGQLGLA